MLAGRLLVGISSANLVTSKQRCFAEKRFFFQAPSRAYVAGATFKEERSSQLSMLSLFQVHPANVLVTPDLTLA